MSTGNAWSKKHFTYLSASFRFEVASKPNPIKVRTQLIVKQVCSSTLLTASTITKKFTRCQRQMIWRKNTPHKSKRWAQGGQQASSRAQTKKFLATPFHSPHIFLRRQAVVGKARNTTALSCDKRRRTPPEWCQTKRNHGKCGAHRGRTKNRGTVMEEIGPLQA